MKAWNLVGRLGGFAVMGCLFLPQAAQACATCFGASDDPLAKGMNMGILSLLVVVVMVLSGVAAFGVFLARRAVQYPDPIVAAQRAKLESNPAN